MFQPPPRLFRALMATILLWTGAIHAIAQDKTTGSATTFSGTYQAANTRISAKISENNQLLRGEFVMDGDAYRILGSVTGKNTFGGKIVDERKNKFYDVAGQIQDDTLSISILLPELDNKIVNLLLTRSSKLQSTPRATAPVPASAKPPVALHSKEKNAKLFGTWRHTEVLSSGLGGDNATLVTDYFIQFKSNGESLSWSGSSAGGSADVSLESRGNGQITREEWYTEGKTVTFVDPQTREENTLTFFAEENRMLLKGRSSSTVYQRVR